MADDGLFDIVVVGAGPAGCVLARRLTEDPERRVALLEAGPDYGPDPNDWPADLHDSTWIWPDSHPWGYLHAGRPADRPLPLPRARIVGGTSTINACVWLRGSAADYDGWAALGNPGWSFADLLPYFKRAETDPLGGPLHGTDGPGGHRRRRIARFPVRRRPQWRPRPAPEHRSHPEEHRGWHADERGLHPPCPSPPAPQPLPPRGCARRARLHRGRPRDRRAPRRWAGGARAAGRPLWGGLRVASYPAPLRHRARGGPQATRHPCESRPTRCRCASVRPPQRGLRQWGRYHRLLGHPGVHAERALVGSDTDQGAQPPGSRGDRPLHRPRSVPRRGAGTLGRLVHAQSGGGALAGPGAADLARPRRDS